MRRLASAALLLSLTLAGCGQLGPAAKATSASGSLRAANQGTKQAMEAIMRATLSEHWKGLMSTHDRDRDGVITQAEYEVDHDSTVTGIFLLSFDPDADARVTAAEVAHSLQDQAVIDGFTEYIETRMNKALRPYLSDKSFEFDELRTYMVKDLGMTADWPFVSTTFDRLDLNHDETLLSDAAEQQAFTLLFARAQLEQLLGMPISPLSAARAKRPAR